MREPWVTDQRLKRLTDAVDHRQFDLTVILENVHDPHNIGAVLRSCDSVGIREVYLLYTSPQIKEINIEKGRTSSTGAHKWLDMHEFRDVDACMSAVRKKYKTILGTHLDSKAENLYDLNLCESVALMFGNEHAGISDEALKHLDGNFIIPQVGFVKSLNISVACAVTLYEAYRQRFSDSNSEDRFVEERDDLLKKYIEISRPIENRQDGNLKT